MILVCSSVCFSLAAGETKSTLKDRVIQTKDGIVKKVSASLLLFKGDNSVEAQEKRLELYNSLQDNKVWQSWAHHPKRLYKWIITGKLVIKNIDTLVRDEEYVECFLAYKTLILGRALTEQEVDAARTEANLLLEAYKTSRGIR
jgi:hypothetical protein